MGHSELVESVVIGRFEQVLYQFMDNRSINRD